MSNNTAQNLQTRSRFQKLAEYYLQKIVQFIRNLIKSMTSGESFINFILDPISKKLMDDLNLRSVFTGTYSMIRVCIIFLFAPFLFVVRISMSILWVASKFGRVPAFFYMVTGIAFIVATWKTVTWMIDEYKSSVKRNE